MWILDWILDGFAWLLGSDDFPPKPPKPAPINRVDTDETRDYTNGESCHADRR